MARTEGHWTRFGDDYIAPESELDVLIGGANKYLNFNVTVGSTGYGFRDNAGAMQVKDTGGAWSDIATADDLDDYFYLPGRSGGQVGYGGTDAGDELTLESTSHATKGDINLGTSLVIGVDGTAPGNSSFGYIKWPNGGALYEQADGGDPVRFFYLASGDRWECLNQEGTNFLLGVHGTNSALPSRMISYNGLVVGNNFAAVAPPTSGLIVEGDFGAGTSTPDATYCATFKQTATNFTVKVIGNNSYGNIDFFTTGGTRRGMIGYDAAGGFITGAIADSLILRGENGITFGDGGTSIATMDTTSGLNMTNHPAHVWDHDVMSYLYSMST